MCLEISAFFQIRWKMERIEWSRLIASLLISYSHHLWASSLMPPLSYSAPFQGIHSIPSKIFKKNTKKYLLEHLFRLLIRKKSLWKGGAAAPELRAVVSQLWMPAFPADCRHLSAPSSMASFSQDKKSSLRKKKAVARKSRPDTTQGYIFNVNDRIMSR